MCILPSDIGNRITELNKAICRMHSDIKLLHQHLVEDGNPAMTKDSSSFLGKYIIGAKNNFRGFNSKQDDTNTLLKVTVHNGEEEEDQEKVDIKQESGAQQNQVGEPGAEGSKRITDCDVVKMEEGRAKVEQGDKKETEKKEQAETDKNDNSDNEVKGEIAAGASFNNVEEKVEGTQDEAETRKEGESLKGEKVDEKHTDVSPEQTENMKVNIDIELQEKKVEARWVKGRKFERNITERSGVKDSNEKPGTKKIIPSPTGSSSSQDTGFGSQEGEGSIDGMLVSP